MSWSPELFIGELRPWPDTVHVVRGKTDEMRRYVPEVSLYSLQERATCNAWTIKRLKEENAKLLKLAVDLWCDCPIDTRDCAECKHHVIEKHRCDLYQRMIDMGVVDE